MKTLLKRSHQSRGPVLYALVASLMLSLAAAAGAAAQCAIDGTITAEPNGDGNGLGAWKYTMTVTWDTGTQYALSHLNLWLDEGTQACGCEDIGSGLTFASPAGTSDGDMMGDEVQYGSYLECYGDPSLGLDGIIIKFEPLTDQMVEPGATGTAVFVFYSEYPPAPVALPNMFLTDKAGQTNCSGQLTGVFPGLPCDPTGDEPTTWGGLKARYGS